MQNSSRNKLALLPEEMDYAEIARITANAKAQGYTWAEIAEQFYAKTGLLTTKEWRTLSENAYRRYIPQGERDKITATSSKALVRTKSVKTQGSRAEALAQRVADKETERAEKERIKQVKREFSEPNTMPSTYEADYIGADHLRIGIISDTHFGSKWTQYSSLRNFYEVCGAAGVTDIYHAGDLDDGSDKMHVGVVYEHHVVGGDAHIDNIVANYPHIDGITTHFITGNHDASFGKAAGINIGLLISERRQDMHYLGRDIAHVQLTPNCKLELRHPGDGSAYALSYKLQKLVETYDWDDHPSIVVAGHYHKYVTLYHRGILLMHPGCFQGLTDYMRAKLGYAAIGGVILDIALDADGRMVAATPTWVPYREIKDDYKHLS